MSAKLHISSLLITAKPSHIGSVSDNIKAMAIAEVAHADQFGKIIVTLETPDESAIVQALTDIQLFDGVVSAALVYHHAEAQAEANRPASAELQKGPAHV